MAQNEELFKRGRYGGGDLPSGASNTDRQSFEEGQRLREQDRKFWKNLNEQTEKIHSSFQTKNETPRTKENGEAFYGAIIKTGFWVIAICVIAATFAVLYPLTVAMATGVGLGCWSLMGRFFSSMGLGGREWAGHIVNLVPWVVGGITLWFCSRAEHQLDEYKVYRYSRHALRLVILSGLGIGICILQNSGSVVSMERLYIVQGLRQLSWIQYAVIAACVLTAHCVLIYSNGLRERWNNGLEMVLLRR